MLNANDYDHWQREFDHERARLLAALGEITAGGIVDHLEHIGATSVPGLTGQPCLDIGLAVWPFPLELPRQTALEALGYERIVDDERAPEQRFRHTIGNFQLYIIDVGNERWTEYLLLRDYLRHTAEARQAIAQQKQAWAVKLLTEPAAYQATKAELFSQTLIAARQWWVNYHGFTPVEAVAHELKDFSQPWYISSGWALDLFLGRVRRVHQDVDVVVARADQLVLQQYMTERHWKFVTPFEKRLEPWPIHMRIELPRFQVHAHRGDEFIDFLLTDIEQGVWRYRRNPMIIQTMERSYLTADTGIRFLAPELVLLFKSKNTSGQGRSKDQLDFEEVKAHLTSERRVWLRWALLVTDPTHAWLEQLMDR